MTHSSFLTEPQSYKWSRLIHHSNAQSDTAPRHGHVEHLTRVFFLSVKNKGWINYFFSHDITSDYETKWKQSFFPFEEPTHIRESIVLLPFSLLNAGHSQCQLIAYFNIISKDPRLASAKICVSSLVREYLPFVYDLLILLFTKERILEAESRNTYFLSSVYAVQALTSINIRPEFINVVPHNSHQKLLLTSNPSVAYTEDIKCIKNVIQNIESAANSTPEAYEKVFFVKTIEPGVYTGSPNRAIQLSEECINYIRGQGFKILGLNDFRDLSHCITILSRARRVVTSWGNIAAANRFFYNFEAEIVLLGNKAYSNEYSAMSPTEYFKLLVFPVAKQFIIRDFPDIPSIKDLEKAFRLFQP